MKGIMNGVEQAQRRMAEEQNYRQTQTFKLEGMTVAELIRLRDQIDARLPAKALKDVNLEQELLLQYALVKELQADVLDDELTPANQKAQVASQVAATLQQMVKMQTEFYNAERFKAVENLMISALRKLPVDVAEKFIHEYENLD